jgi:hypothetical protein
MFDKQRQSLEASKNYQKVKTHVQTNQKVYIAGIGGAAFAGITCFIMRGAASQPINCGTSVVAERGISVLGKKVVMSNVSYISADRQGPPSWVVRCKQTGDIFTSQRSAAVELGLPQAELSKHLNGVMDNVRGYNFERICLAA